jgi:predicted Zn-dependent peptidase
MARFRFHPHLFLGLALCCIWAGLGQASAQAPAKSKPKPKRTKEAPASPAAVEPELPLDRSQRPSAQPAPVIRWADAERWELNNGLKVFLVSNRKLPRLTLSLAWNYDPVLEGNKAGVSSITGELIRCGTESKTKEALDEAIDALGATLSTSATSLYASSLSRNGEGLMALLGEMLAKPAYRQNELDRIIKQSISGLESEQADAEAIAGRVQARLLYGAQHPYGELTTKESLRSIALKDCESFRDFFLRPNVAYLAIVGDVDRASAEAWTRKYLEGWARFNTPKQMHALPAPQSGVRVVVVDRPQAVQTVLRISNTVELVPGSPDNIPSTVMNTILGASDARLFDNLRETHGFTYGAYSSLSKDRLVGQFRAYAQVRNAVTDSAIREFMYELNRIRDTLVPTEELQGVKNYLNGTFSISLQNPQTVAGFYIDQERYQMPANYYRNYLQELAQVDAESVMSMARKMIQPQNCLVLCVGKGEEIAPKLKVLDSDGVIEWYDWNGEVASDPTAVRLPEGTTLSTVLQSYIQATGGTKAWSKVKSLRSVMSATLQGMNLDLVQLKRVKPLCSKTTIKLNGTMVVSTERYQDGLYTRNTMQGPSPVDPEEVAHQGLEAMPLPETGWLANGNPKLVLGGGAVINKEICARLDWNFDNGNRESHFYSLTTGLKVQTVGTSKGPDGKPAVTTTIYDDYRDVGKGIRLPHKVTVSMGPQQVDFQLKEGTLNPKLKDADFAAN